MQATNQGTINILTICIIAFIIIIIIIIIFNIIPRSKNYGIQWENPSKSMNAFEALNILNVLFQNLR